MVQEHQQFDRTHEVEFAGDAEDHLGVVSLQVVGMIERYSKKEIHREGRPGVLMTGHPEDLKPENLEESPKERLEGPEPKLEIDAMAFAVAHHSGPSCQQDGLEDLVSCCLEGLSQLADAGGHSMMIWKGE